MSQHNGAKKSVVIHLSGCGPIRVRPAEWPVIAHVSERGDVAEGQADHVWWVRVRQHSDGRFLVYGGKQIGLGGMWPDEVDLLWPDEEEVYSGLLLQAEECIVTAVEQVAEDIGNPELADRCVRELPSDRDRKALRQE